MIKNHLSIFGSNEQENGKILMKRKLILILSSLIIILACIAFTQLWQTSFAIRYDYQGNEHGKSIIELSDGYMLLSTSVDSLWNEGFQVTRTDLFGEELWNNCYYDSGYCHSMDMETTSDSSIVIAGYSRMGDPIFFPFYPSLLKIDFSGTVIWHNSYQEDTIEHVLGVDVEPTLDKGYIFAGIAKLDYDSRLYMLKIDENGTKEWAKVTDIIVPFSYGLDYKLVNVRQAEDSSLYFTTYNSSITKLIKTDRLGNEQWTKEIGSSGNYRKGLAFIINPANEIVITGRRSGGTFLLKTDLEGNVIWEQLYDFSLGNDVDYTLDGGYILAGFATKTNSYGQVIWDRDWDDLEANDVYCGAYSIIQASDGGYAIVGADDDENISFLKLDDDGLIDIQGISENANKINIYPIPAHEFINIDIESNFGSNYSINLFNQNGALVQSKYLYGGGSITFSRNALPSGVYIIHIKDQKGFYFQERIIFL